MNTPKLTEPGFKYVLNNALHNCKIIKYKHFNKFFNISLFVIFVIILAVILITKYMEYIKGNFQFLYFLILMVIHPFYIVIFGTIAPFTKVQWK